MKGHNVSIIKDKNNLTRVWIDGNEVRCTKGVSYNNSVEGVATVTIEFVPETLNVGGIDYGQEDRNVSTVLHMDKDKIAMKVMNNIKKEVKKGVMYNELLSS